MKKQQLIEGYHRFRRWQQEGPHYVNHYQDTVQHCQNCGTEFADNFCPRCGQRAGVGRVGWKSVRESIAILWGLDSRSLGSTLFQLLLRPGYLVRDYISGHRQVSFPPVKMLVLVSLLAVIVESVFHVQNEVVGVHFDIPEVDKIVQWFNDNKSWGTLAAPLLATPFTHGEIGVLMRKGQDDLLNLINAVIAQMKDDGTLRELHEKYGLVYNY